MLSTEAPSPGRRLSREVVPLEPPGDGSGTLIYGGPRTCVVMVIFSEDDEGGGHRVEHRAHEEVEEHEELGGHEDEGELA